MSGWGRGDTAGGPCCSSCSRLLVARGVPIRGVAASRARGGGDERDERGGPVRGDAGNSDASIERRERASSESGTNVSEDGEAGAAEQVGAHVRNRVHALCCLQNRGVAARAARMRTLAEHRGSLAGRH